MFNVNIWAIVVSTLFSMVLGALWYTPVLFGTVWMKLVGMKTEEVSKQDDTLGYIVSAICHFIGISTLAFLINVTETGGWLQGLFAGLAVSALFMGTSRATNYVYEKQPFALFLVNTGYNMVVYGVAGVLLAVWA